MSTSNVEAVGGVIGSVRTQSAAARDVQVRPLRCNLGGTVSVDYEVVSASGGLERRSEVRVEFPDEVRGLLETACGHAGVVETIDRIGGAYLRHLLETGELKAAAAPGAARALSLEYLRAALAALTTRGFGPAGRTRR